MEIADERAVGADVERGLRVRRGFGQRLAGVDAGPGIGQVRGDGRDQAMCIFLNIFFKDFKLWKFPKTLNESNRYITEL